MNSHPIVISCSGLNLPIMNLDNIFDFPTSIAKININLYKILFTCVSDYDIFE